LPDEIGIFNNEDFNAIVSHTFNPERKISPLELSEQFGLDSLQNFEKGLFQESIILIQTCIEVYLKILFIKYANEIGMSETKQLNCLDNYKNLILQHCPKFLNGDWTINGTNSEFNEYWNLTYALRNKIVHTGFRPDFNTAWNAINAAIIFKERLPDLIKDSFRFKEQTKNFYFKDTKCYVKNTFNNSTAFVKRKVLEKIINYKHEEE